METNTNKKILWLQQNYKNYSTKWYLENPSRLDAIYKREYAKYVKNMKQKAVDEAKAEIDSIADRMRAAYNEYYHSDYDSDFKANRRQTHDKVLAITELWVCSGTASA